MYSDNFKISYNTNMATKSKRIRHLKNKKISNKKKRKIRKKNKTKKTKQRKVGLILDTEKNTERIVKLKLNELLKSGVINDDIYNCIITSGEIFEIIIENKEQNLNLNKDELVKFLLINSQCNYIGKTIISIDDELKRNIPRDFYNCIKLNNLIENVVITQINKGFFRTLTELIKIIMEDPECEDFYI